MISTNDMRAGQAIIHNGRICFISEYERVKPGKGPTFVRVKLKDLNTGQVLDHTWRGEQKVELAILSSRAHQYLYNDGHIYHFMDLENYDQLAMDAALVEDVKEYLVENLEVTITFHESKAVRVQIPTFMEMKVVATDPGVKGDTVTGGTKPATLASGVTIQVPLFVNIGDVVKVDTRTGTYVTRVATA